MDPIYKHTNSQIFIFIFVENMWDQRYLLKNLCFYFPVRYFNFVFFDQHKAHIPLKTVLALATQRK